MSPQDLILAVPCLSCPQLPTTTPELGQSFIIDIVGKNMEGFISFGINICDEPLTKSGDCYNHVVTAVDDKGTNDARMT